MRKSIVGALSLVAGALLLGCGGTEMPGGEQLPLQGAEQELRQCGQDLPPCPTGWYCSGYPRGACKPNVID